MAKWIAGILLIICSAAFSPDKPASHKIHLHDVPAGKYNKLTFTLGIPAVSLFLSDTLFRRQ